ncbi:LysR family transcriptional regulator [Actinoalloteichus spitiensis]|uniref:LysR family transcriptional regulator n=1 Tax=Actinoalloteichus spitiensis TaxID=252394 RepID=UPI0003745288|nr:LysR substrate-binding domain-containing protein [Actinoalloteichus spitiensis]
MTLQQLVYFLAVAETRHFTRAADLCHVAQPSLSKQIRALEGELGAALFRRSRGNITLTPAGEALLPLATRITADVDTARREVGELVGLRRGRVQIGATPSLCLTVLAPVLRRFHESFPGIRLVVEEGGSQDLIRELTQGRLDLALIITPPGGTDPALSTTELLREELVVASSGTTPLPSHPLDVRALADHPMIMFRPGYDLRTVTLAAFRAAGVEPRMVVEGGELDAVLRFVQVGLGAAIVPSMVLADRPGLRRTPLAAPGLSRTVALAHRGDTAPTHAARALRDTLFAVLADTAADGRLGPGVRVLDGTDG